MVRCRKRSRDVLAFMNAISNEHLVKALKKLTKSDLEIIELKYRFGLSINEIAIKLSLNNESAKKTSKSNCKIKKRSEIKKYFLNFCPFYSFSRLYSEGITGSPPMFLEK